MNEARILLTGASSGIGRETALELARRGSRLAIVARREKRLRSLAGEILAAGGFEPLVLEADLSLRGAGAEVAERAVAELGGVDVLINNAGGGVGGSQWTVGDGDAARETFELNLWTPFALTAAIVPEMRRRGTGSIVNVTSIGQVMPMWSMGHYVATKGALALATESLRLELTGSGVHVLEVVPGPTDTAVQGESKLLPGASQMLDRAPLGSPRRLAKLIADGLERNRRRIVYPGSLRAVYAIPGAYRLYAGLMANRLARRMVLGEERVVRTGSGGDPLAREARREWEAAHTGGQPDD